MSNILIRDMKPEDVPFICDSCWRSMKQTMNMLAIKAAVNDPGMTIKVACLPDDENVILGYKIGAVWDKFNYTYVKVAFRGMGIEKELEEAK